MAYATSSAAETGFLDRSIMVSGNTYRYQVYVPADYVSSRQWPVVLFLHGNGKQGDDGTQQTNGGFANDVRLARSRFPAIIVFAQAQERRSWSEPEMENLALAQLAQTEKEFRAAP